MRTAAIALITVLGAAPVGAQSEAPANSSSNQSAAVSSSSEKVRDNPAAQYVLVKTVVGQVMGVVDARAKPVEPEGYNLLKYCWTAENVLGDWAERAGLTGAMVVRALETRSWQRDLARAGYPEAPTAEAIGHYEAMLVSAGFTDAARSHAVDALIVELVGIRQKTPGAAQVRAIHRCDSQQRSLALNYTTAPEDGRARFMPYVLHQICQAQQLNPDDQIRCDYWMYGKTGKPMSFAGETVYSVRWLDGSTANGRFDPEQSRSAGTVTLRLRPPKATK
ncbi:hypothetical protein [Reyranella soli]|uniref:Uncharacterized protein n=1 Tax=Reyranella soli TaxID=1230389 RepID=A0A512NRA1_9HYPH|nr:hypothetical protein [Reyranella soli]GEP61473.1 hypothetical protein RSO01_86390 [Reyranella soli]